MEGIAEIGNSDWTALGVVVVMIVSFTGIVWRFMYSQSKQSNKLIDAITNTTGATDNNTAALEKGLEKLTKGFGWMEKEVKKVGVKVESHIEYSQAKYAKKDEVKQAIADVEKKIINTYKNKE